ncbi:hypothetical protein KC367_g7997 [Hortaea werneckii]|nr:hypothetical protein KC357_g8523 [Hortaea werneckii]KAI7494473.1 hypothetical protein KC367_g7997 [Hortaea werneckii]
MSREPGDRLKTKPALSPTGCSEPATLHRTDCQDFQLGQENGQENGLSRTSSESSSHAAASFAELFGLESSMWLAPSDRGNMPADHMLQSCITGTQAASIDNQCSGTQTYSEDDELFSRIWSDRHLGEIPNASIDSALSAQQVPLDSFSPPAPVSLHKAGSTNRALSPPQSLDEIPQAWNTNSTTATSPVVATSKTTLDTKLGRVLEVMIGEGFPDFEDMAQAYYTGTFATRSDLGVRQGVGRKRNLPRLIEAIHYASSAWPSDEAKLWRDAIVRSAEATYLSELNGVGQTGRATYSHGHEVLDVPPASESMADRDCVSQQIPKLWSLASVLALHAASSEIKKKKISTPIRHVVTYGRLRA